MLRTNSSFGLLSLFLFFALLFTASCKPEDNPPQPDPDPEEDLALLLQSYLALAVGESERFFWIKTVEPFALEFEAPNHWDFEAYKIGGEMANDVQINLNPNNNIQLQLQTPDEYYFIRAFRPEDQSAIFESASAIAFFPNLQDWLQWLENDQSQDLKSPLRRFPSGEEETRVPSLWDYPSLEDFTKDTYGYNPEPGTSYLNYLIKLSQLAFVQFAESIVPAGSGAWQRVPPNAEHDDNYCGIYTFGRSMMSTFPGSISSDVFTDQVEWDKIGDQLSHSCYIGIHGSKMENAVNRYYQHSQSSLDGKRYCCYRIQDTRIANLRAWKKDCDVKLLSFDVENIYGHWTNVKSIDPNDDKMTLQDYDTDLMVGYTGSPNGDRNRIDYTNHGASRSTPSTNNFGASDPICGDHIGESSYFYAVCECEFETITTDSYDFVKRVVRPTHNSDGQPMNP